MKVVILAAGFGARFGDRDLPKPLTLLESGHSILQLQIEQLSQHVSLHNIIVVVGYHKEQIIDRFPDLLYVYNPNFAHENTAKSLLRAIHKINEDLLWLNGDVVFHPTVLKAILEKQKTSMVVNEGPVEDEEVKYISNNQGKILKVSKEVINPQGEALGINFFDQKEVPLLKEKLQECSENDYFERGIEMAIEDGLDVWTVKVPGSHCIEIDFAEDLDKANKLLHKWRSL